MADIKQDFLSLNCSASFPIQGMEEADINLSLSPATGSLATVYGTVTDGTLPLPNATVKLFDSRGVPYQHTVTDQTGAYTLSNIPAGTYSIGAVLPGYLMSGTTAPSLAQGSTTQIPLVCAPDATLALGAIAGVLTATADGLTSPLGGAKVSLLSPLGDTVAATYTAGDGEFVFYDVADGVYTLVASADGYLTTAPTAVTIAGGSIANVAMTTTADSRTYNGTVSGIIRSADGSLVAGCFVGLYRVVTLAGVTTETLIATTKTNSEGKYLFGGVSAGEYLVKAKLEQ